VSARTTMSDRWSLFRARRLETYSRAVFSWEGSCLTSSSEEPASSGDEMRSFEMEGIVISGSIDGNVMERFDDSQ
jgi:hypothetical protein